MLQLQKAEGRQALVAPLAPVASWTLPLAPALRRQAKEPSVAPLALDQVALVALVRLEAPVAPVALVPA